MVIKYYCKICDKNKLIYLTNSIRHIKEHLKKLHSEKFNKSFYSENKLFGMEK